MTLSQEQIRLYRLASQTGMMPDDENPLFIFQGKNTQMLVDLLNGDIRLEDLIEYELRSRGFDSRGEWVGFTSKTTKP